jgi:hypothetical protein
MLVLAGLVLASGCMKRPHSIVVSVPPALQTVIALDKDGNRIVAGSFTGRITVAGTTLNSQGGRDIFVVKTDKTTGAVLFGPKQFGGKDDDNATAIAVGPDGGIAVAGTFQSSAHFGDKDIAAQVDYPEQRAVFVAKLNSSGEVQWVKQAGFVHALTQIGVAIGADGGIVVGASGVPMRGPKASAKGSDALAKGADASPKAADASAVVAGESLTLKSLTADGGDAPPPPMLQLLSDPVGCDHNLCQGTWSSPPLVDGCGMYGCTAMICLSTHDPYCCTNHWDPICVGEVFSICHRRCDCADICAKGEPFYPDACNTARAVIAADPSCGYFWGSNCVALAGCP